MSRPGFAVASVDYWPTRLTGLEVLPSPGLGAGRCALPARCFSVFLLSWRGWWVLGLSACLCSPVAPSRTWAPLFLGLLWGYILLLLYWLRVLTLSWVGAQIGRYPCQCASCLGVFPSSWVLGVPLFAGGSVPYLGSSWCLGLLRDILCCSFTGCRCLAPAPGAAALTGLLSFLVFSGMLLFASRAWVPAGFLACCRVHSALLLCWLPLFGAYSRRCGSCRPPEFPGFFGVPLFASRTWVPAGFLVCCRVHSALLLCWLPLFGAYSRHCGSCRPPEFPGFFLACFCSLPVLGFLLVSWFVVGYTLLCSSAGCRCSVPTPGAAALAGLLSFLVVFGVPLFASRTWVPAGFLVCCRVHSALLLCWLPLFGAYSRRCGSCRPPEFPGCFWRAFVRFPYLGSCWFPGLLSGTLCSAPLLAAAVRCLLPALRLLPAS